MSYLPAEDQARFRVSNNRALQWILPKALACRSPLILAIRSRLTGERSHMVGTISVVVPFFNVEKYLSAALESIRLQRYWDLEVVLVDDGSTDRSPAIADYYVRRDSRFRLLRTNRVGPGAARNVGVEASTGEFLAFVDGDDILPIGALSRLAASLKRTDSDFAVGGFEHLEGENRWRSAWVQEVHGSSLDNAVLGEISGITRNVFPWNKLFRREFFINDVGLFPEGILYEDQVPTARAFVKAQGFDVLSETVYHWRKRESGDSITQNRSEIRHLENRISVMADVSDIYFAHAPNSVYRDWIMKSLLEDMMPFIEASGSASDTYRELLTSHCKKLWNELSEREQHKSRTHENAHILRAVIVGDYDQVYQLRDPKNF